MAKIIFHWIFHILCILSSVDGHLSCLHFLAIVNNDCCKYSCKSFCTNIRFHFSWLPIEVELLGSARLRWDTAGQERFHTITTSYYRGAMGIMLVYDITNGKSFENISKWLRNIDEHANEDVERMLLGNKCDMDDKRVVPKGKGEQIAREHGIRFFETSAKANINIEKAFLTLAEDILRKTPVKEPNSENVDISSGGGVTGWKSKCC
uniref:small monomeric GTPase n=1 Tax=Castor canadensis TaxID=51338 RepID=A0A8C0W3K9_CASCN